ncbi:MAG: FAD binding domain-containing protein [Sphaerochaetaceae bacterium]|nr:FAD binding domain-containing protein [Sphaerochaetaceae bacterium]
MVESTTYVPTSLAEALKIRKETGARPLAGGTDLMVAYRRGIGVKARFPWPIMIISRLQELQGISTGSDGSCVIGAGTTAAEIAGSPLVPWHVRQAAGRMGAISLRNLATIGGNIGNASPKGDLPCPLILLDAQVELASAGGTRRMPLDEFIVGSKKTLLGDDELITKVIIPAPARPFSYVWYRKIGTRRANAISKLSLCAAMTLDAEGKIIDFRAASGAAGPKIARSRALERTLIGLSLPEMRKQTSEFLDGYNGVISPHAMPEYRRVSTRRMLEHFLHAVVERPADCIIE